MIAPTIIILWCPAVSQELFRVAIDERAISFSLAEVSASHLQSSRLQLNIKLQDLKVCYEADLQDLCEHVA